jgi:hypothetical protein
VPSPSGTFVASGPSPDSKVEAGASVDSGVSCEVEDVEATSVLVDDIVGVEPESKGRQGPPRNG